MRIVYAYSAGHWGIFYDYCKGGEVSEWEIWGIQVGFGEDEGEVVIYIFSTIYNTLSISPSNSL